MSWKCVVLEVRQEISRTLADFLEERGAVSVTLQDAASELLIEPVPGSSPMWQQVRITALYAADVDLGSLVSLLQANFPGRELHMRTEALPDRDWSETWRETFKPMCFGNRLWVCPTGSDCPQAEAVIVRLDPGNAFGTGTHATTAMCLEWLDGQLPEAASVIDYGCGSGILAIAACKLGARHVLAVDIDAQAVTVTLENAALNGIDTAFEACLPEHCPERQVDVVIANILANPLCELAAQLCAYLRPGGAILLTGILEQQAASVQDSYSQWISFDTPVQRDEWVMLSGFRRE
jgi:ribosomal protein L11 methyltransferase